MDEKERISYQTRMKKAYKLFDQWNFSIDDEFWNSSINTKMITLRIEAPFLRSKYHWIAEVNDVNFHSKTFDIDVIGYMLDWNPEDYGVKTHAEIFKLHALAIRKHIPSEWKIRFTCYDSDFKELRL